MLADVGAAPSSGECALQFGEILDAGNVETIVFSFDGRLCPPGRCRRDGLGHRDAALDGLEFSSISLHTKTGTLRVLRWLVAKRH